MNILPHKSWHVRTKKNIARVRKDEALAAEKAKIEEARIRKAETEARIKFLKEQAKNNYKTHASSEVDVSVQKPTTSKHINFFEEVEKGDIGFNKPNKEYEKDKKEEKEKYEKQIGLLTYLGQDVKEAVSKSWYNELPKRLTDTEKDIEVAQNKKIQHDPLQIVKKYLKISEKNKHNDIFIKNKIKSEDYISLSKKRKHESSETDSSDNNDSKVRKKYKTHKKHKKHKKKHKHDKSKDESKKKEELQKLRAERLAREQAERLKAKALLVEINGQNAVDTKNNVKQKYNSQFFPELARQNLEKMH